jgi:hypothetical protein
MKEQTKMFSDEELDLIKLKFENNLPLLKAMRKVFLQIPISEKEDIAIKTNFNDDLIKVVRKAFLPTIDGDAPINQVIDLWMTIKIDDKNPEEADLFIKARAIVLDYIDQQLNVLAGNGKEDIKFIDLLDDVNIVQKYINLIARNTIILHTENQLNVLNILANMKEETEEEQKERQNKDSSK